MVPGRGFRGRKSRQIGGRALGDGDDRGLGLRVIQQLRLELKFLDRRVVMTAETDFTLGDRRPAQPEPGVGVDLEHAVELLDRDCRDLLSSYRQEPLAWTVFSVSLVVAERLPGAWTGCGCLGPKDTWPLDGEGDQQGPARSGQLAGRRGGGGFALLLTTSGNQWRREVGHGKKNGTRFW